MRYFSEWVSSESAFSLAIYSVMSYCWFCVSPWAWFYGILVNKTTSNLTRENHISELITVDCNRAYVSVTIVAHWGKLPPAMLALQMTDFTSEPLRLFGEPADGRFLSLCLCLSLCFSLSLSLWNKIYFKKF